MSGTATTTVATSITPAQSFHFAWTTTLLSLPPCTAATRTLALTFSLPPAVFADPYELDLHHESFSYAISYEPDLERPVWAVQQEPVVLHVNASRAVDEELSVTLPVHARYIKPQPGKSFEEIILDAPAASVYCGDDATPLRMVHPETSADASKLAVRVPLGRAEDLQVVEAGTALVVFGAFMYLLYVCLRTARRLSTSHVKSKDQ